MSFADLVASIDRSCIALLGDNEPVTYAPAVGSPVVVTGIFDERYVLAKGDAHAGASVTGPAVFLRVDDIPADPKNDHCTITIRGVDYRAVEREPDGLGGVLITLRRKT